MTRLGEFAVTLHEYKLARFAEILIESHLPLAGISSHLAMAISPLLSADSRLGSLLGALQQDGWEKDLLSELKNISSEDSRL